MTKKGSKNCSLRISHKTYTFMYKIKTKAKPWTAWFNQYLQDIKSHWYYVCAHTYIQLKEKQIFSEGRQTNYTVVLRKWGGSLVFFLFLLYLKPPHTDKLGYSSYIYGWGWKVNNDTYHLVLCLQVISISWWTDTRPRIMHILIL